MEIVACGKGHFYDKSMGRCPQCAAEQAAVNGIGSEVLDYGKTMPNAGGGAADPNATMPVTGGNAGYGIQDVPPTRPLSGDAQSGGNAVGATRPESKFDFDTTDFNGKRGRDSANLVKDYPETRPAGFVEMGNFNPTVGWLICIEGPNRGTDYRIHTGNNCVGRSPQNDIFLQGDLSVSARDNCSIAFDNRGSKYFLFRGTGRNMVYVNNKAVTETVELNTYDVITVGNTNLMFVPLCGEHFSWNR